MLHADAAADAQANARLACNVCHTRTGASWSSIDYGGVWKPLHHSAGRMFAPLALSMQHDLHNMTIQVLHAIWHA